MEFPLQRPALSWPKRSVRSHPKFGHRFGGFTFALKNRTNVFAPSSYNSSFEISKMTSNSMKRGGNSSAAEFIHSSTPKLDENAAWKIWRLPRMTWKPRKIPRVLAKTPKNLWCDRALREKTPAWLLSWEKFCLRLPGVERLQLAARLSYDTCPRKFVRAATASI